MQKEFIFKKNPQKELVDLENQCILITGATGTFGKVFVNFLLENYKNQRIIIFSRDELKQNEMREEFHVKGIDISNLRFFLGDVRDYDRLKRAFSKVDIVVHAAALKQVVAAEYNPIECIKTNVNGAENVINAAIDCKIKRVIALSTDKAVNPVNLYGATKLCSDKLFISANNLSGADGTIFSVVRYGNVIGSRGSVIPLFMKEKVNGVLPITDKRMTRFWISINKGVEFVHNSLKIMKGGEIFVPKISSMKITDLANAICPGCKHRFIGVRQGEKLHEIMISSDDANKTIELEKSFIICPDVNLKENPKYINYSGKTGIAVKDNFEYTSNGNNEWMEIEELEEILK